MMPTSDISEYAERKVPATQVEMELNRLLQDKRFATAPQMSAFLKYIVTETLAGNQSRIKAYSVGVDALGKPPTFDAQNDPSVRVLALRLRKTLALIYSKAVDNHAVIDLTVGTYVPEFLPASKASTISRAPLAVAEKPAPLSRIMTDTGICENRQGRAAANAPADAVSHRINQLMMILLGVLLVWSALKLSIDNNGSLLPLASHGKSTSDHVTGAELSTAVASPQTDIFSNTPTIYLPTHDSLSAHEQDVSVLIGTYFTQSGRFKVIRPSESQQLSMPADKGFQMVINEIPMVGSDRLDVQIVNLSSNQIVFASTLPALETDLFSGKQTRQDLLKPIEKMTIALSDPDGPLYRHFCHENGLRDVADCKMALLD